MIDRKARDKLSELIRHFVAGLTDCFQFDDATLNIQTEDSSVKEIRQVFWTAYDDLIRHRLKGNRALSDENKQIVMRMLLFLKTDNECVAANKKTDMSIWPFLNHAQYQHVVNNPAFSNKS